MNILNLQTGVKNPAAVYDDINFYMSKCNIIYIPFPYSSFNNWYMNNVQLKQHYKTIIIPDKVKLGAMPVRQIQNYVSELKKEVKGIRIEKIIKNSISSPVIVDLSPVAKTFWQLVNSRGIKHAAPDFFNFVNSIYQMLAGSASLRANETIVVFDYKEASNELEKLLLYTKLNDYAFTSQIADRYVFFRYDNKYLPMTTDGDMVINKNVFNKIIKISKNKDSDEEDNIDASVDITSDLISKAIRMKFNKNITDKLEIESIVNLVKHFLSQHPDIDVNIGDTNELANLIQDALKKEINIGDKPVSFDELLDEHKKQFVFKKDVEADKIHDNRVIGLNGLSATGIKWITDSDRTKTEFDENLDRNVEHLFESLNDPKFKMQVLGMTKDIKDDGRSKFYEYKLKLKPDTGRAYQAKLRVPALVNGTYFKIGGNLYAINNQLMQLPIIKKNANTVQLKTNYSVTDYSIKSFPLNVNGFSDIVNKFLNIMKSTKKLKEADVIDAATEARLKEFGLDTDSIASLAYKKISIKE